MPEPDNLAGAGVAVSVIICAWNAEATLSRAIESALAQVEVSVEVIVIDDQSSDRTFDIACAHRAADGRVRALQLGQNMGPAAARNAGLDIAQGDWIAVLDADDTFAPARLSNLLRVAARWKADIAADNLWLVDGESGRPFDLMLGRDRLSVPRMVTATSFVENNMPIDVKRKYGLLKPIMDRGFIEKHGLRYESDVHYGEDFLFYLECLVKGARFVLDPEAHYFYALSRQSMTRTRAITHAAHFLEHCDRLLYRRDIRAMPSLVRMLTRRSFQLRSDLVYLQVVTALKKLRLGEALGLCFAHPDVAPFMVSHLRRAVLLRLHQMIAGRDRPVRPLARAATTSRQGPAR